MDRYGAADKSLSSKIVVLQFRFVHKVKYYVWHWVHVPYRKLSKRITYEEHCLSLRYSIFHVNSMPGNITKAIMLQQAFYEHHTIAMEKAYCPK